MLLRPARLDDLFVLAQFARGKYYLNVPDDVGELKEILKKSEASFQEKIEPQAREYVFVMEHGGYIIGTSCIISKHGTHEAPHLYFKIETVSKYSESIKTGFIQEMLKFEMDDNGPTEIGGLVVDPNFRGTAQKVGKQLSYVRFAFIKMHRDIFEDKLLSELMAPMDENGKSLLWEAVGRNFVNLSYKEADQLSRKNKEFVLTLFPDFPIYLCMLPAGVRECIGRVQKETEPALHMLKKIGFQYEKMIDPFDGGPHLWADTDQVIPIMKTKKGIVKFQNLKQDAARGLISVEDQYGFRAMQTVFQEQDSFIFLEPLMRHQLQIVEGNTIWITPYV